MRVVRCAAANSSAPNFLVADLPMILHPARAGTLPQDRLRSDHRKLDSALPMARVPDGMYF
jgi:hypothetical protein